MPRTGEQAALVGVFDDAAQIHHGDACGDVLDHREIVRDEDVGELEAPLQIGEQIDHLRLYGHIERGNRFVAHDQSRLRGKRARDADALSLAA